MEKGRNLCSPALPQRRTAGLTPGTVRSALRCVPVLSALSHGKPRGGQEINTRPPQAVKTLWLVPRHFIPLTPVGRYCYASLAPAAVLCCCHSPPQQSPTLSQRFDRFSALSSSRTRLCRGVYASFSPGTRSSSSFAPIKQQLSVAERAGRRLLLPLPGASRAVSMCSCCLQEALLPAPRYPSEKFMSNLVDNLLPHHMLFCFLYSTTRLLTDPAGSFTATHCHLS